MRMLLLLGYREGGGQGWGKVEGPSSPAVFSDPRDHIWCPMLQPHHLCRSLKIYFFFYFIFRFRAFYPKYLALASSPSQLCYLTIHNKLRWQCAQGLTLKAKQMNTQMEPPSELSCNTQFPDFSVWWWTFPVSGASAPSPSDTPSMQKAWGKVFWVKHDLIS
jgi:hypothetical protein